MQVAITKGLLKRKKLIIIGITVVILAAAAFTALSRGKDGGGLPVATASAEKALLGQSVFTTGRVQLAKKQELYAYNNKFVTKILVKPGDKVTKGQIMGYLESAEEKNKLKEAEANLAVQQAEYEGALKPLPGDLNAKRAEYERFKVAYDNAVKSLDRTKYLYEQGVVSALELETAQKEFSSAEAEYLRAKADWDRAENGPSGSELKGLEAKLNMVRAGVELTRENLNKCILTAEMDGTVMTVEVRENDYAAAGTRLITVGNPDSLEVEAGIGEADSGRLQQGQEVVIVAAALPEVEFTGKVSEVAGAAVMENTNNGQQIEVPVTVSINPGAEGLRPGYTVDLKIITEPERMALVVPYGALFDKDGAKYVFTVRNNRAHLQKVRTGLPGDLNVEVLEGLKEGDKVIVNPPENVKDGSLISEQKQPPGGK